MITIGIDNGVSGSIAVVRDGHLIHFGPTPTAEHLHYGKKGSKIRRVDFHDLASFLRHYADTAEESEILVRAVIERPMKNPGRFTATESGLYAFEACRIALEVAGIGYTVVDSRSWQKKFLGEVKGSAELKKASLIRGIQMFPKFEAAIRKQKDADSAFLALSLP